MTLARSGALAAVVLSSALVAGCSGSVDAERPAEPTASNPATPGAVAWQSDQRGNAVISGRFFAATSPWNQQIDTAAVDADSATMIDLAQQRVGVVERSGDLKPIIQRRHVTEGLYINTERWTTPVVTGGVATRLVCRQDDCGDEIPDGTLPVPPDNDPVPAYDGWFTILHGDTAYDLWRARREVDGTISYHYAQAWELDGQGEHPPETVSARGSGLPLFAGLITSEALASGRIEHALAISVPGPAQRRFVAPASATDGNGQLESVPVGARLRLRADVQWRIPRDKDGKEIAMSAEQRRAADALIAALRRYGAIVVDRAAVPTLYAQRDVVSGQLLGNELQGLTLDDFDVTTLGKVGIYAPKGVS